jgi:glycosyltransferase involved in cell wall biosynthesis
VRTVHVVVPEGIDDPTRPSGGNTYDRRVCLGLVALGWEVREYAVRGPWPSPDARDHTGLADVIARIPDHAKVLVDGLVGSTARDVLVPASSRLRLVVLVHVPFGDAPPGHLVPDARSREGAVLSAAAAVVTTSEWTRQRLLGLYALPAAAVHVAPPGVELAAIASGTPDGDQLLCVAAVAPHKGQEVLIAALASLGERPWRCACVGTLDRDPPYVEQLRRQVATAGLGQQICFTGALTGVDLDRAYDAADVLVLASHGESYGMVVTEALAHGLPVVATDVGGLPEALGRTSRGHRPGLLVPAGDPPALAAALRSWLDDAELRQRLRGAAVERRATLSGWTATTNLVAQALVEAGA